jgi:ankyrin repeat protein
MESDEIITLFLRAIREDNLRNVIDILDSHPSLLNHIFKSSQVCNDVPHNAFVEAVKYNSENVMKELVNRGVDVNQTFDSEFERGFSAAVWAALNCHEHNLDYLRSVGVDFNKCTSLGNSPLFKAVATKKNKLSQIIHLIENFKLDINTRGMHNDTLLHCAAESGILPHFRYLHEKCNLSLEAKNVFNITPAFKAAGGSVDIIDYLIRKGYDFESMIHYEHNFQNYAEWTPLHYAAESGNTKTFEYLVNQVGLDHTQRTYHGSNCMLIAAGSNLDLVKLLRDNYYHDPHIVNGFGENSIFVAAKHNKPDIFRYLLFEQGVNCYLKSKKNETIYDIIRGKSWEKDILECIQEFEQKNYNHRRVLIISNWSVGLSLY